MKTPKISHPAKYSAPAKNSLLIQELLAGVLALFLEFLVGVCYCSRIQLLSFSEPPPKTPVLDFTAQWVVDRLAPMVGFTMRVTERGGTPLGSLLSNKNVRARQECGRLECRVCLQTGEKREDCVRRNILYESECVKCGSEIKDGDVIMERSGTNASLYVGETSRSLFERTSEHWQAADSLKEESHMVQHIEESHKGEGKPDFKFKVVKTFKTALDRQIAEAVRIEMRGNILNRRGEYNRCSLTRLGVDKKWEEERWKKSWEENQSIEQDHVSLEESRKTGRGDIMQGGRAKRRKLLGGEEIAWGEAVTEAESEKQIFLNKKNVEPLIKRAKQSILPVRSRVANLCPAERTSVGISGHGSISYEDKYGTTHSNIEGLFQF